MSTNGFFGTLVFVVASICFWSMGAPTMSYVCLGVGIFVAAFG